MISLTTSDFVAKVQQELADVPAYLAAQSSYIDLSEIQLLTTEHISQFSNKPLNNPLTQVFDYIIQAGVNCRLEQVQLGCNELLKAYTVQINRANQKELSIVYTTQLQYIFLWCLDHPFIYISHLWLYLVDCLKVVAHYILDQEYFEGCLMLIEILGLLGQGAVKKGLSTQRLQRLLRTLEVRAEEMGWITGVRQCRQQRHDIELI